MSCQDHVHDASTVRRKGNVDPTRTTKVRTAYRADMLRRFRLFKRLVVEAIVKLDVLGLRGANVDSVTFALMQAGKLRGGSLRSQLNTKDAGLPPRRAFSFERSADKVDAFMAWLHEAESQSILGISTGMPKRTAAQSAWQNIYLETAYRRGIRDAGERVKDGGATVRSSYYANAMNTPIHADAAGLIYTRVYGELEGVTAAMEQRMSRMLAQGLAEGLGAEELARELADAVEEIGIARAEMIARTETIAAYAEATLNTYEEAGVAGVEVEAEFTTSGDDAVCPECEDLEGKTFPIDEARGMIPVHPNCRCAFLPVVGDASGVVLE